MKKHYRRGNYKLKRGEIYSQAQRVVIRFGGIHSLAKMLGVHPISIRRWDYEKPRGSGGLVPNTQWHDIVKMARLQGFLLSPTDFDTRKMILINVNDLKWEPCE